MLPLETDVPDFSTRMCEVFKTLEAFERGVTVEKLLGGTDIDTLKLRDARKLAKVLGIAQKVNGKDQKLDWLKAQIQAKIQQKTLLLPEVMAVARGEVIAC